MTQPIPDDPGPEYCICPLGPRDPATGDRAPIEIDPDCPVRHEEGGRDD